MFGSTHFKLASWLHLQVARDNIAKAVELLALVIQHPASDQYRMLEGRIRDSAKGLLAKIEEELPQERYLAALERGQALDLDEVVADLIGPKRRK